MKIGFSGHQHRKNLDYEWIRTSIYDALQRTGAEAEGLCALAAGCDQIFAECILDMDKSLTAIIPRDDYESFFRTKQELTSYKRLVDLASQCIELHDTADPETSFLRAGLYIVNNVDTLIVVWDGKPAKGRGGTADVIKLANERQLPLLHINPVLRKVTEIGPWHSLCS
jgi:hypothetical protein